MSDEVRGNICIVGGTGFVGQALSRKLIDAGWSVKLICRSNKVADKAQANNPNATYVVGNPYKADFLSREFLGCAAVINLVGILNQTRKSHGTFQSAHIDLPKIIGSSCREAKVPRLLHMSALNAHAALGASHYLLSKGEGESAIKVNTGGKVALTMFRPSVIFGPNDGITMRFAGLLRFTPFIFPLACPNAKFAPVYIDDVCSAFITALEDDSTIGQRYELCGPQIYTLKQIVSYLAQVMRKRRWVFGLPDGLTRLQAKILQYFPGKPFTPDNYKSLQAPSVCSTNGLQNLGISASTLEAIVPEYLAPKPRKA